MQHDGHAQVVGELAHETEQSSPLVAVSGDSIGGVGGSSHVASSRSRRLSNAAAGLAVPQVVGLTYGVAEEQFVGVGQEEQLTTFHRVARRLEEARVGDLKGVIGVFLVAEDAPADRVDEALAAFVDRHERRLGGSPAEGLPGGKWNPGSHGMFSGYIPKGRGRGGVSGEKKTEFLSLRDDGSRLGPAQE